MSTRMSISSGSSRASSPREPSPPISISDSDDDDVFTPPSPELVAAYTDLMAGRLPHMEPVEVIVVEPTPTLQRATSGAAEADGDDNDNAAAEAALGRPLTKGEKQNAKKKRRKERERQLRLEVEAARAAALPPPPKPKEELFEFRLFASTPVHVSLSIVEDYAIPTNPRLTPLAAHVQERIHRLAAEAAVDGAALAALANDADAEAGPSSFSSKPPRRTLHATGPPTGPLPPVFVAMRDHTRPWGDAKAKRKALPGVKVAEVAPGAIVKADAEDAERLRKRARRSRTRYRLPREFPGPKLWRPFRGMGGKSAGYAYGWGG